MHLACLNDVSRLPFEARREEITVLGQGKGVHRTSSVAVVEGRMQMAKQ